MILGRLIKLAIVLGIFGLFLASFTYIFKGAVMAALGKSSGNCVLVSPYKNVNYKVYGNVFEPNLSLAITTKSGFKNIIFLVDSGAVVSTIPKSFAKEIFPGNMESLERTVLKGFGGAASFGYVGNMKAKFGSIIIEIPVVFSESDSTRAILGRKGFLEIVTTRFDHKGEFICIVD